ncbi:glutaredoxin family protein [Bacillus solitudinis]|uniref:glutaredoxin family protein n=1 Tax=Bacillus solitudinis TaxID=2014074 RepID=UPI000C25076C|nr:glutaredoxin family protein [Bacillus solitudinis]
MVNLKFFSKTQCPLCDKGLKIVQELQKEFSFQIDVIDIYEDDELLEKYQVMIPVVTINDQEIDFGQLSKETMRKGLQDKIG